MSLLARVLLPLLIVLSFSGCSTPQPEGPTRINLDVTTTAPAQPETVDVPLGSVVTLMVDSEADGLIHVHGFEEKADLVAGESVEVTFTASMAGAFEVETHDPDAVWMKLVVS